MNRQSLLRAAVLLLPLLAAACSADQMAVVILSARAPGDECKFDDDTLYVSGGSVDMRTFDDGSGIPGQTTSFYQVFSWENNLLPQPLSVNGQVVDPGAGNNFIADQVSYIYQFSDPSQTFEPETANLHAVIPTGGTTSDSSVGVDLIQPKAAAKLVSIVSTTPQTLLVTFQILGRVAAGNSLTTNSVSFPLTVFKSSNTELVCPVGQVLGTVCGSVGRDTIVHCTTPSN